MRELVNEILGSLITLFIDWVICTIAVFIAFLLRLACVPSERIGELCRRRWASPSHAESRVLGIVIAGACFMTGCNTRYYMREERLDKGLVVILPGIDGPSPLNASIRRGLDRGGLPYALEIYNWHNHRLGASYAFTPDACRERASEIAAHVAEYRDAHPGRTVFVVGHSAGGAIGTFAAEAMPPDAPLDGLIILAPALGPTYDVTAAIRGSGGRMINCWASNDYFLRTLTTIGQNLDGFKGRTAGQEGFCLPEDSGDERRRVFEMLVQIEWDKSMRAQGHWGGHRGWTSGRWVAANLAPRLTEWSAAHPVRGQSPN